MYRDVLLNKWFLGAFILFVICSIGCLLWYQNEMAKMQKEVEANEAFIAQLEAEKKAAEIVKQTATWGDGQSRSTVESAFFNKGAAKASDAVPGKTKNGGINNAPLPKTKTRKVRVSPYGFGPYPEIPEDFPAGKFSFKGLSEEHELLMRVWIKLWKQGEHVRGITFGDSGLVYPIIPGKVYVEYQEAVNSDGTVVREAARYIGHPDDFPSNTNHSEEMIEWATGVTGDTPKRIIDIPSHLEVLSFDEGIDPYHFLDLQ